MLNNGSYNRQLRIKCTMIFVLNTGSGNSKWISSQFILNSLSKVHPEGILQRSPWDLRGGPLARGGVLTFFAFISLFFPNYSVFNETFTLAFWTFRLANI